MLKFNKKTFVSLCLLTACFAGSQALADNFYEVSSYSPSGSQFYTNGVAFMKSAQYTNAIAEFRKALRENPTDKSSRIQLVNAYLSRAQYFNNKALDYNKSANDLRSAIFYMKYYEYAPVDAQYLTDLNAMEENLNIVLRSMSADLSTKGRFTMGKSLRAQGEFAAAAVEFQAAQTDSKYRAQSYVSIGDIYYVLNLNEQAARYFDLAIGENPKNSDAHLRLARVYERMGQLDKAAEEYTLAMSKTEDNQDIIISLESIWRQKVAKEPNNAEAHANLGAVYQKKGDFPAALAEYKTAESLNPTNATTRLNLGTLYQAQKDYDTAIEAYDTIIAINPNHMQAYLYKAQCYKALGNKEAAMQNYTLASNLAPNDAMVKDEMNDMIETNMTPEEKLNYLYQKTLTAPGDADLLYDYAYELHKANRLPDAIIYYNKALTLDAKNEDTYINMAQAFKQQGDYEKARQILTDAKGLFPDNPIIKKQLQAIDAETGSLLYSDASEFFKQQKYKEAMELYKKIIPATPESLVGAGACYQALSSNKTAAEFYKKALALDPNNADTAYYLALAYSNDENFASAKVYAQKALALVPTHKDAKDLLTYVLQQENTELLDKAVNLFDQKQYTQALTMLNTAISRDPKNADAFYYRGMIYDVQKKYLPAIADYKKALANNPQMTISLYSVAIDYDYLLQYANAVVYFKKYLAETQKAGETNDYTRYAAKRIQELKKYDVPTAVKK